MPPLGGTPPSIRKLIEVAGVVECAMYYTYIVRSQKHGGYYIGSCGDIAARLKRHNAGRSKYTKSGVPWDLVHTEEFETRVEAVKREIQIKSYKGGEAFKRLIKGRVA